MTPARRLAVVLGGLVAGVLVVAATPTARAANGQWEFVDDEDPVVTVDGGTVTVAGQISPPSPNAIVGAQSVKQVTVTLTRTVALAGCPATLTGTQTYPDNDDDAYYEQEDPPPGPPPSVDPDDREASFAISIDSACNGTFTVAVSAVADTAGPDFDDEDDADDVMTTPGSPLPAGTAAVSQPAPEVASVVTALGSDRVLVVAWQPPADYGHINTCTGTAPADHPDFAGYEVLRKIGDGAETSVATLGPTAQCFRDPIAAGSPLGQYHYRVVTLRQGADGQVVKSAGVTATATVGPPTTTTTPPPTSPPTRTPGTSTGGGGGSPSGGSTAVTALPVLDDGTFDETLDYDDEEPGELAAEVPDGADTFLDFVPSPGPGILVPFAIAELLAVWAFHLRYLARRAADDGY